MANPNGTEREFTKTLIAVLNGVSNLPREEICDLTDCSLDETDSLLGMEANSFSEEGIMTSDQGLVVRLPNGCQFQITVVKSR